LGLEKLMAIEVPMPSLAVQQTFDRLQAEIAALKAKHTASRCAKASLGAAHRLRALTVSKTGVMQNCLSWSGHHSPALPSPVTPYAPPSVALVACVGCGLYQLSALHHHAGSATGSFGLVTVQRRYACVVAFLIKSYSSVSTNSPKDGKEGGCD
jgi:hypothetical protein